MKKQTRGVRASVSKSVDTRCAHSDSLFNLSTVIAILTIVSVLGLSLAYITWQDLGNRERVNRSRAVLLNGMVEALDEKVEETMESVDFSEQKIVEQQAKSRTCTMEAGRAFRDESRTLLTLSPGETEAVSLTPLGTADLPIPFVTLSYRELRTSPLETRATMIVSDEALNAAVGEHYVCGAIEFEIVSIGKNGILTIEWSEVTPFGQVTP